MGVIEDEYEGASSEWLEKYVAILEGRSDGFGRLADDAEDSKQYWLGKKRRNEEIASDMNYVLKQRRSNES